MQNRKLRAFHRTALVAASLAVLGISTVSAQAAPTAAAPASGSAFGSVDLDKVLTGYTKKNSLDNDLQQQEQRLQALYKIQVGSPMLTKAQQDELGQLLNKPQQTDADRAQITALQQQSAAAAQQLATLQQKQNPTDEDKATLSALTKQQQDGQQILQDVGQGYQDQMQAQTAKLSGQLTDLVKAAVVAVAQQRGLSVVFDSHVAIYSANDITEDVVRHLNTSK